VDELFVRLHDMGFRRYMEAVILFSTGFWPGGGTDLVYLVMAFELLSLRIFYFYVKVLSE